MTMYRKEIKAWPQVKNGDANSFQKIHNFLVKCEIIALLSQWNLIDTPDVLCMLLSKLSGNLRHKWVQLVMKVRRKDQREATLCDFVDFIREGTMLVNDPLFSKEAIEQYNEKRSSRQENTKKRISTFVTKSRKVDISGLQKVEVSCIACGKSHVLGTCEHFMKNKVKEKTKLLKKEKCCYACTSQ